jgi:hypothetical protein
MVTSRRQKPASAWGTRGCYVVESAFLPEVLSLRVRGPQRLWGDVLRVATTSGCESSAGAVNAGHAGPRLAAAIARASRRRNHQADAILPRLCRDDFQPTRVVIQLGAGPGSPGHCRDESGKGFWAGDDAGRGKRPDQRSPGAREQDRDCGELNRTR